jgi:hypothetical protein
MDLTRAVEVCSLPAEYSQYVIGCFLSDNIIRCQIEIENRTHTHTLSNSTLYSGVVRPLIKKLRLGNLWVTGGLSAEVD